MAALRERVVELEQRLQRLTRAEEQADAARAQVQALLDNIPHMAWMKSLDGVFLAVNEAYAEACGYDKQALIGKTDRDIWPIELAELYIRDDRKVIDSRRKFFVEEPIAQTNGTRWFETFKAPVFDGRGQVIGTVGLARDITDRKLAEEQARSLQTRIQQAQKLESLGVLAGGIAHDFNNLLVGVLGNAELALRHLAENDGDEALHQLLSDIRYAASSAAELTNQMLAYSGRGRFVIKSVCLNELLGEMAQLLQASISKKAVLEYELARPLRSVRADVAQLKQVIMNLITNASDAVDARGGRIVVRTGQRTIPKQRPLPLYDGTDLSPGAYVFLSVSDDGAGMSEETLGRLFEPFYSTKFTGRGLGLSAVQGIVRGHQGGIIVDSQVGVGTSITVFLPSSDQVPERVPSSQAAPPDYAGRGLVLLVDDDERVRKVTELLLREVGFDVVTAETGDQALRLFASEPSRFRLVLLDLTMPDLSGDQVFERVRGLRPDIPVLVSSGYDEQDTMARFGGGAVEFLPKPYRFEVLQRKLRKLCGSSEQEP